MFGHSIKGNTFYLFNDSFSPIHFHILWLDDLIIFDMTEFLLTNLTYPPLVGPPLVCVKCIAPSHGSSELSFKTFAGSMKLIFFALNCTELQFLQIPNFNESNHELFPTNYSWFETQGTKLGNYRS